MAFCKCLVKNIIEKIGYDNWRRLRKVPYKYNILKIERASVEKALQIVERLVARHRNKLVNAMERKLKRKLKRKLYGIEKLKIAEQVSNIVD